MFFQFFFKILKIFENCSVKMQKSRFFGKIDGLPKLLEGIISIIKTILRDFFAKAPLQHLWSP